jgi:preprotein translocase subunit SecD
MARWSIAFSLVLLGVACGEREAPPPDVPPPTTILEYGLRDAPADAAEALLRTQAVLRSRLERAGFEDATVEMSTGQTLRVEIPTIDEERVAAAKRLIGTPGRLELRIVARDGDPAAGGGKLDLRKELEAWLENPETYEPPEGVGDYPGYRWATFETPPEYGPPHLLLRIDRIGLTGEDLTDLEVQPDPRGSPLVFFRVHPERQDAFARLTGPNSAAKLGGGRGRQLAIVLDGKIRSAPVLQEELREAGAIHLGAEADREEADALLALLAEGSLGWELELLTEVRRESRLARD